MSQNLSKEKKKKNPQNKKQTTKRYTRIPQTKIIKTI
jgi:hypothetical protein